MKNILISIKPEWVEKILNGEKTIEIRKSMPKCELPCKVYIYCTKDSSYKLLRDNETRQYFKGITSGNETMHPDNTEYGMNCEYETQYCTKLNGKVVAEFTLNRISMIRFFSNGRFVPVDFEDKKTCLTEKEMREYLRWNTGYTWNIDNLEIYGTPKELREFGLRKASQSWCYVEGE